MISNTLKVEPIRLLLPILREDWFHQKNNLLKPRKSEIVIVFFNLKTPSSKYEPLTFPTLATPFKACKINKLTFN